jgi:hypothetical protein
MEAHPDDDAMLIRFRPTDPDAVLAVAQKEYRRTGRFGLSVFAGVKAEGESDDQLRERILRATEIQIDVDGNPKYWLCERARELSALGFTFYKDGDAAEIEEHYSVDLGSEITKDDVIRFLEAFEKQERRS